MDDKIKGFDLIKEIIERNPIVNKLIKDNMGDKIRFFDEREWEKIDSQNYVPIIPGVNTFRDIFEMGYNIGDCVGISTQLSYSYDNVDMVAGTVPFLKGAKNAEQEGGHRWLETPTEIIDTSLMLVIDKSLKSAFGYQEEMRLTASQLRQMPLYQKRKEFINDRELKKSSRI